MMAGQANRIAFSTRQDKKAGAETSVKIQVENWKTALYVFEGNEMIGALYGPIRFIWIQFTKPEVTEQPEPRKGISIQSLLVS